MKAILFDIDNTLYDLRSAHDRTVQLIMHALSPLFDEIAYPRVRDAFAQAKRVCSNMNEPVEVFRSRRSVLFLGSLGLDEGHADAVTRLYIAHRTRMKAPVPGARAAVEALAPLYRLGVISNGIAEIQRHKLRAIEVDGHLDCVVISEEAGVEKPDPSIFVKAASLLGVALQECLYVGDDFEIDVIGATKSGMQACWFNPNGSARPPGEIAPEAEIRELRELIQLLQAYPIVA